MKRFPKVGESWRLAQDAGLAGPLDEKAARLVKLGIAIGTLREGAVHSAVRKAVAAKKTAPTKTAPRRAGWPPHRRSG